MDFLPNSRYQCPGENRKGFKTLYLTGISVYSVFQALHETGGLIETADILSIVIWVITAVWYLFLIMLMSWRPLQYKYNTNVKIMGKI